MFDNIHIASVLVTYVAVLFSLSVHEAAHATAAYLLEDDTARRLGRMTLNPIAHIDLIGTVLMPLIGMLGNVRVLGWAKPVPVDPNRLTRRFRMRVAYAMVAGAGPASNLVQSLVFLVALCLLIRFGLPVDPAQRGVVLMRSMYGSVEAFLAIPGLSAGTALALTLLGRLVAINIGLAIFNLLPFGPLDGASILRGFLPWRWLQSYDRAQPIIGIVLLACFFILPQVIMAILSPFYFVAENLYLYPLARLLLGV